MPLTLTTAKDFVNGIGLNWVANLCTRSMSFDKTNVLYGNIRSGIDFSNKLLLGFTVGGGNTYGLLDGAAKFSAVHSILVKFRIHSPIVLPS